MPGQKSRPIPTFIVSSTLLFTSYTVKTNKQTGELKNIFRKVGLSNTRQLVSSSFPFLLYHLLLWAPKLLLCEGTGRTIGPLPGTSMGVWKGRCFWNPQIYIDLGEGLISGPCPSSCFKNGVQPSTTSRKSVPWLHSWLVYRAVTLDLPASSLTGQLRDNGRFNASAKQHYCPEPGVCNGSGFFFWGGGEGNAPPF